MSGRIRLAFILPHLRPGGAERVVVNYLRALDRTRFAPFLFLGKAEGAFLDLVPGDVVRVDLGGSRARRLPRRIAAALDAHGIDVAYSATDAVNLALLVSRWWGARGTRRIVSVHTTPGEWLAEARYPRLRRLLMRALYPKAPSVAVPTDAIGRDLTQLIGRPLILATLPNPVVEQVGASHRPAGGILRIVAAGRLVESKGFDLLIDAAAILFRRGIQIELVIHGEGPLRQALLAKVEQAGLAAAVSLPGYSGDLSAAFAGARLCVVPSRREGFGNVVVEAMAAGVPVLAAACPGPAGLIEDGHTGFLVPPGDAAALADAIEALLKRDSLEAVSDAAADTAQRYLVGPATRRLEQLVENLAGKEWRGKHPDPGQRFR